MVKSVWRKMYGSGSAVFEDASSTRRPRRPGPVHIGDIISDVFQPEEAFYDRIARRLAPTFAVSVQAMKIRLEYFGLLLREARLVRSVA
jgi:hypothetical protein